MFYFICIILIVFDKLLGNGDAQLLGMPSYSALITRADIFYVNPVPAEQPIDIRISELRQPFKPKSDEIKVIIHGWNANGNHVSIQPLRYAYLASGHDAVFVVDWSQAAAISYLDARYFVRPVGLRVAKLLDSFLRKNNISPAKVHVLGHSLGAHIAGNLGSYFNGTIGRITGLDQAGPLFENFVKDGLQPRHALFVDSIHTDSPILGQTLRRGHIDFYPNRGVEGQPGCELLDFMTGTACSHYRAVLLYAESIQLPNSFPSFSCPLKYILAGNCMPNKALTFTMMGEKVSKRLKGTFTLKTNNVSPFGKGMYSTVKINKAETGSGAAVEATPTIPTTALPVQTTKETVVATTKGEDAAESETAASSPPDAAAETNSPAESNDENVETEAPDE